jgi:hypothetical protein
LKSLSLSSSGLPDLIVARDLLKKEIEWKDLRDLCRVWSPGQGAFLGTYISREYLWIFLVEYPYGRVFLQKFKAIRGRRSFKKLLDLEIEPDHPVAVLFLSKIEEMIEEEQALLEESIAGRRA